TSERKEEEQQPEPETVPEEEILVKKPAFTRYPLPKVTRQPVTEAAPRKEEPTPAVRPKAESVSFVKLEPYTQQTAQKTEPAAAEPVPAQQKIKAEDIGAEPTAVVETGGQILQPEEKELRPEPEKEPEKQE